MTMKKTYLSLLFAGIAASGAIAQNLTKPHSFGELAQRGPSIVKDKVSLKPTQYGTKMAIWSEDFAGIGTAPTSTAGPSFTTANGTWTTGGADGNLWKHSFYTSSGVWSTGLAPFASTTPENGFMLIDVDSLNTPAPATYINATGELISPVIDLTGASSAKLSMKQNFRWCCNTSHTITISISSDNGATWGTPFSVAPASVSYNDDYQTTTGSYDYSANITGEAAGNSIMLKFTWDGVGADNASYFWNIDDIEISELPDHDIAITYAYISGENNGNVEYGRTPLDQVDPNYLIGAGLYNGGANAAINSVVTSDFVSFSSTASLASLDSDSTGAVEASEALTFAPGVYTGTYTVVSDGETAGTEFYNNTLSRTFEITNSSSSATTLDGSVYSLDGIDVYPSPTLSSIGTDSFDGGEDGFVVASMYHIKNATEISGIRIMLANGTVAGGSIYGSIKDTATFWANDMASLFSTNEAVVTAADLTAGYVDALFDAPVTLNPGIYYGAAELYSNSNLNDIRILDDETVQQPWAASAIYIQGDQSWTNGTASGVRLLTGGWVGIDENTLDGVSIFPNPSEGIINVTNDNNNSNNITVYNTLGKVVFTQSVNTSTTINLSAQGTGVYVIEVTNENGSFVERVIIK